MARKGRGPETETHTIGGGEAELLRDADRDGGWVLLVGGVPQSYVDLSDPTYLDFEYMQLMGAVVDAIAPAGEPLDAVHIGGAGCTLPRYVAATRPRSRQVVLEPDGELVRLVRERLPVKGVPGLRIRITDGRSGVAALPDAADDLVVMDAFAEASMPPDLATREFVADAARVLRPGGVYLAERRGRVPAAVRAPRGRHDRVGVPPHAADGRSRRAARPQVRQPHPGGVPGAAAGRRADPPRRGRHHPGAAAGGRRSGRVLLRRRAPARRRGRRRARPAAAGLREILTGFSTCRKSDTTRSAAPNFPPQVSAGAGARGPAERAITGRPRRGIGRIRRSDVP
ncbi:fused MFS/spermidine synthase [Actinomadura sp. CNU-125]|uniref:spermidine synthase n=1 Tax=Actinomadura sp. CNU-125 TaxID=1904961 RepID=UPI000B081AF7|nr:fused MFS/spermidine synthase [Actinomadura sp. CNU-125]